MIDIAISPQAPLLLSLLLLAACGSSPAPLPPAGPDHAPDSAPESKEAAVITDPDDDGILADHDQCPDDPEDLDGFEDEDGCPDPDNDQDKIPDAKDECPDLAETFNACEDEDGCPDACEPKVKILQCCMVMWPTIYFKKKSPEILVTSMPILEETAAQLLKTPEITKIIVEGMSDEMKKEADNLALSEKRAKAVADELVARGVDPDILIVARYGDACGEKKKTKKDKDHDAGNGALKENGCYGVAWMKRTQSSLSGAVNVGPASAVMLEPSRGLNHQAS